MRVAATSQLSALLEAHWLGAKAVFADVESPISLEFLTCGCRKPVLPGQMPAERGWFGEALGPSLAGGGMILGLRA
jgi:hypothetical protein